LRRSSSKEPSAGLELVAAVLELLDALDDPRRRGVVERDCRRRGLVGGGGAAGQLGDEQLAGVATEDGSTCSNVVRVGADARRRASLPCGRRRCAPRTAGWGRASG
jgi:hypothetical protein